MTTATTLANGTMVNNGGYAAGTAPMTGITMASPGTGYITTPYITGNISAGGGGTGYITTPYITVTGAGGGGGTGYSGQILTTTNTGATSWQTGGRETIRISAGDIFQGGVSNADDGLFARLERLERLMGIMRRDRTLEGLYEPMRQLGDAYDDAVDDAIQAIMEVTLGKLKAMEQEYESMREQAKVWRALSKDD